MSAIHDPLYIEFISRLRRARKDKDLSQKEFGKLLGKKQSYVSKVETCERRMDVVEAFRWCQTLGVNLVDVLPPELKILVTGNGA